MNELEKVEDLEGYFTISKHLVREDRLDEWKEYLRKTVHPDDLSKILVDASLIRMVALSTGYTAKEANDRTIGMGLSGQAGYFVAGTVSYFSKQGDKYKEYWNGKYLPRI